MNANGAKSPTVAFRVRGNLYDRLKASAEARGYSLSEEIEHRLNRSMDTAGDHFAEHALRLISDNWRAVQSLSGRKMTEDRFTLQACCEAAYRATELLAGVNGMDLNIGMLDSLGPEGINVEAAKQLGHAIVWHREVSAMDNPPEWAVSVYQANVVDALAKRVAYLQARVGETPGEVAFPAQVAPQPKDASINPDGPHLIGMEAAGKDAHNWGSALGQLPPSIGDRALWDEINGPERPDDEPPPPAEPPVAPKRRGRAKAEV